MTFIKHLILFTLVFYIQKCAANFDNDHGAVLNIDRQSPGILKEIKNVIMALRKVSPKTFENEYLNDSNKQGFHMMKEGSELEGYFTVDIKNGKLSLLYKAAGKSFKEAILIGLVDVENIKTWSSIPLNEKNEFFKLKNARGEYFGVKAVDTTKDEL